MRFLFVKLLTIHVLDLVLGEFYGVPVLHMVHSSQSQSAILLLFKKSLISLNFERFTHK